MLQKPYLWLAGAAFLAAGCSSPSATFRDAEALAAQGKDEEAAAKFDLVCALDPQSKECPGSGALASASRVKAAEAAEKAGEYKKAERLYRLALLSADEAPASTIKMRLGAEEMKQGLRFEQAAADPDKLRAADTMTAVAATQAPVAEKAKAWIAAERPNTLVAQVKAACRPKPKGSCSKTWAELEALAQKPAGYDDARALHEAELKRIKEQVLLANRFLGVYKSRYQKKDAFQKCVAEKADMPPSEVIGQCAQEVYEGFAQDRYDAEHQQDEQFRQALAKIADPELVAALEKRKEDALSSGKVETLVLDQPAGGKK
jgi:ferritin-like metal-binding protein YciE